MKPNQIFRSSLLVTAFTLLIMNVFSFAGEKTAEISLPTVQCGMCARTIEKALNKVEGVTNIDVDIENKKATITYDDSKTSLDTIEKTITSAGYGANDKKADQDAYEKLHGCCKVK